MKPFVYLEIKKKRIYICFGKSQKRQSLSLIEVLVVIVIIGILASVVFVNVRKVQEQARLARAEEELHSLAVALELYANDNGGYPPDVSRGMPSGIEAYLPGGRLPLAAWPGSVFDWDNGINPSDGRPIYEISIRFCPLGSTDLTKCHFPDEPWAKNFNIDSSAYYCISGNCTGHLSHINDNPPYPSYCLNCSH